VTFKNDAEVGRQITQMVQFIKQEAEEKANEIAVAAEEARAQPCCETHTWGCCVDVRP
jgi:hypothetical protein